MVNDVIAIDKIVGMPVLSRTTGNKLGTVYDLYIDPSQGVLRGVTIQAPNNKLGGVDYNNVYSFGSDAVMISDESNITVLTEEWVAQHPHARKHLIGTRVLTEGGNILGEIGNVHIRLTQPPMVVYEMRGSMWDNLMGRGMFFYAANAGAISSNAERMIVPNAVVNNSASSLNELLTRSASGGGSSAPQNRAA